ncbi:MAG TPA: retropepsin-like aspartic protease [Waterburya sp.]
MWNPSTKTGTLLVLSSLLALGSVGCASDMAETTPSPSASLASVPKSQPTPPKLGSVSTATSPTVTPSAPSDTYDRAIDAATGAITISKSAVSRDDWKLVANHWQQAINLLKQVPASSSQHSVAVKKLPQYQRFLAEAKEKATPAVKKNAVGDINPQFFSIPIKGRNNGTPIVEVTFNGTRKFDMLFDTGATVTLITRAIAESLRLQPQGLTKVTVADGADVVVYKTTLKTLEADGRTKRNMSVVVAPAAMAVGLLGQDFYEGYDIAIKEDVIELRRR